MEGGGRGRTRNVNESEPQSRSWFSTSVMCRNHPENSLKNTPSVKPPLGQSDQNCWVRFRLCHFSKATQPSLAAAEQSLRSSRHRATMPAGACAETQADAARRGSPIPHLTAKILYLVEEAREGCTGSNQQTKSQRRLEVFAEIPEQRKKKSSRTSEPSGFGVPAASAIFFPLWLVTSHSAALKTLFLFVLLMGRKNCLLLKEAG